MHEVLSQLPLSRWLQRKVLDDGKIWKPLVFGKYMAIGSRNVGPLYYWFFPSYPLIMDCRSMSSVPVEKGEREYVSERFSMLFPTEQTECTGPADSVALLHDAFEQFVRFCRSENRVHNVGVLRHEKVQRLLNLLNSIRGKYVSFSVSDRCQGHVWIISKTQGWLWNQVKCLL